MRGKPTASRCIAAAGAIAARAIRAHRNRVQATNKDFSEIKMQMAGLSPAISFSE
jgi:hypothetical protein